MATDITQPTPPTMGDFYQPEKELGLGNEVTNNFYAERQDYLDGPGAVSVSEIDLASLDEKARALATQPRALAESSLGASSQAALEPLRNSYVADIALGMTGITEEDTKLAMGASIALQELETATQYAPKDATSEATVFALNPSIEEETRVALAQHDIAAGIVASRLEARSGLDWTGDIAASLLTPFRSTWAQANAKDYYGTLKSWEKMSSRERYAQFPVIEQNIWDSSGNNAVIYQTLIAPFLNPDDSIWPMLDVGLETTAFAAQVFSVARAVKAIKGIYRPLKFRDLALRAGNDRAAGVSTAKAIGRGDAEAIIEGSGIKVPDGDTHFPQLVNGLSGPTQSVLLEEYARTGVQSPTNAGLGLTINPLTAKERLDASLGMAARVVEGGVVEKVMPDEAGFTITLRRPGTESVTPADLLKRQKGFEDQIAAAKEELRALIKDSKVGENADAKQQLTNQISWLKLQKGEIDKALASIKGYKGGGRITSVKLPTTITETRRFAYTVDDTGMLAFDEADVGPVAHYTLSKESTVDRIQEGLTALGTQVDMQQRKVFADLQRIYRDVETYLKKPLYQLPFGRRSPKNRVNAVLMRGDLNEKTFSETELINGVDTDLGRIKLTENEREAYFGMRILYDELWHWLNATRRKDRIFEGQSTFIAQYVDKKGVSHDVPLFAKARSEDIKFTIPDINGKKSATVIDAATGLPIELRKVPDLERKLGNRSKGFVTLSEPFHTSDGRVFRHMLVDVDVVGELKQARQAKPIPEVVLPYRKGYVPKLVADPIYHVVQATERSIVNGVQELDSRTIRGFVSNKEAHAFIKQADIAAAAKGVAPEDLPSRKMVVQSLNRDFAAQNKDKLDFLTDQLFKGAFAGNRTDGEFKIGLEGKEAARMSAFESIQRYNDYVARHVPMHSFKQGMIRRFLNSAIGNDGQSMLENPADWTSKLQYNRAPEKYYAAKSMQDWMMATFAIPTTEESGFQVLTHTLANMLDGAIFKDEIGTKRVGASLAIRAQKKLLSSRWAADPWQAAKSLVFDMYLGMFNPVQLLVQSAGMAIPFSLHPVESAAALPKFMVLRTLFSMRTADEAATVAKAMGLNGAEFKTMFNAFRRSGVADSILQHSDFGHYVTNNRGYYSPGMWEQLKQNGRLFYNMGELNNRTFSWTVAYERLVKQGKIRRTGVLSDKEVMDITNEGLRLGMNMTQANRAKWQTGILALPTQFWKVTTQFYENALSGFVGAKKGGAWTAAESASATFMSLVMFGAAGYSVDELWSGYESWLVDTFNLDPSTEQGAAAIAAARGGFTELLGLKLFGYEQDLSDRVGVASGINMIYENAIEPWINYAANGEDQALIKSMLGASYGINTRLHKAVADVISIFNTGDGTEVMPKEQALAILTSLGDVASSFNNVHQALLWRAANDIVVKSTGETLGMEPGNAALISKALGIDPLAIEKFYIIDRNTKDYEKTKTEVSKEVTRRLRELWNTGRYTDPRERELVNAQIRVLTSGLKGTDREDVVTSALRALDNDPNTEKLVVKMIDGIIDAQEQADVAAKGNADIRILRGLNAGKPTNAD